MIVSVGVAVGNMCRRINAYVISQSKKKEIVKKCKEFYENFSAVKPQFKQYTVSHSVLEKTSFYVKIID